MFWNLLKIAHVTCFANWAIELQNMFYHLKCSPCCNDEFLKHLIPFILGHSNNILSENYLCYFEFAHGETMYFLGTCVIWSNPLFYFCTLPTALRTLFRFPHGTMYKKLGCGCQSSAPIKNSSKNRVPVENVNLSNTTLS